MSKELSLNELYTEVENQKAVLKRLIAWLDRELGRENTITLLEQLEKPTPNPKEGDV